MAFLSVSDMKKHRLFVFGLFLACQLLPFFAFGGINEVRVENDNRFTGRGNRHEVLFHLTITADSETNLKTLSLDLCKTDLTDIEKMEVFSTDTLSRFDERHLENAILIGATLPKKQSTDIPLRGKLHEGENHLWLTCNVSATAKEGNVIQVAPQSLLTDGGTFEFMKGDENQGREILLARTTLYKPGDYNSKNYRIPAIITAADGSLVVATDRRKNNQGDLPEDIDVVCNISHDGGHTWSEPYTIAQGEGFGKGFGDAALVKTDNQGGMMAVFVGGAGLWASTPSNPNRFYMSLSHDNGLNWSEPKDITHFVHGDDCHDAVRKKWLGGFFASGNGLLTRSGRIMFVAAMREDEAYSLNNYLFYSDDQGATWHISGRASVGGDEAKVVELADGSILMSIRHGEKRWYNISKDGGLTWQAEVSVWDDLKAPACNGDIIRYPFETQGNENGLLLQSLPYGGSRKDVRVYVSYDEGKTWPWASSRCLVPYSSAYSSLCVLKDGTIGLYVEEGDANNYEMVFYNFSLEWLRGKPFAN